MTFMKFGKTEISTVEFQFLPAKFTVLIRFYQFQESYVMAWYL